MSQNPITGYVNIPEEVDPACSTSVLISPAPAGTYMHSGASCASMFAVQAICEVDPGATVLASSGPMIGIYPICAKLLLMGPLTFTSGGAAAALYADVESNVTDVHSENVSVLHLENGSGLIKAYIYLHSQSTAGCTNLFFFDGAATVPPVVAAGVAKDCQSNTQAYNLKINIGGTQYYIPVMPVA